VNAPCLLPELRPDTLPLDAALAYQAADFPIVGLHNIGPNGVCTCQEGARCRRPGKHPRADFYKAAGLPWTAGLTKAHAIALWQRYPLANIGLLTGGPGRLVVLDSDGEAGRAQLAAFEAQHGPLPETAHARTGSGDGDHYLFICPDHLDLAALSNRVGVQGRSKGQGLDVRVDGGQIVVAPSRHLSGGQYEWTHRGPIAELPEALYRLLTEAGQEDSQGGGSPEAAPTPNAPPAGQPRAAGPRPVNRPEAFERARMWLDKQPPAIEGQDGSKAMFYVAMVLVRGFCLSDDEALRLLWQYNDRCQPPWDRRAKDGPAHKVRSARQCGQMPFGYMLEQEGTWRSPPPRSQRRRDTASTVTDEPPPAPFVPLETPRDLPRFPVEALPLPVAIFVQQLAAYLECPEDLPACLALGALASVCMRRWRVEPWAGWDEPLNLYLAVALDPGESKSPAFKQVFAPLYDHEDHLEAAWEAEKKRVRERNKTLGKGEEPEAEPVRPRLVIGGDATPEKIGAILKEQGERLTIASAEGLLFDHATGLYSKNGQNNVGVLLDAHDGQRSSVDRMGRESLILKSPLLTVALAVQPTVIRALEKRPDLRGRGLWARFAYSFPASLVGYRTNRVPPVDPRARADWRDLVLRLAQDQGEPRVVRFSPEASDRLWEVKDSIEIAMRAGGPLSSVRDWSNKLRGLIARLAGLLHVAEEREPATTSVSMETLERAVSLGRYFLAHARYALTIEMNLDPSEQAARAAWAAIERHGAVRVTPAEVGRWVKALRKTPDAVAALRVLCERGYLELERHHKGKGQAYLVKVTQSHPKTTKVTQKVDPGSEPFNAEKVSKSPSKSTDLVSPASEPPPDSTQPDLGDLGDIGRLCSLFRLSNPLRGG
jgi:replicative DNA helicase